MAIDNLTSKAIDCKPQNGIRDLTRADIAGIAGINRNGLTALRAAWNQSDERGLRLYQF